ncbi:MAG: hypothetical protein R3F13_14700 [Prosthecobacter sp.]
MGIWSSIRDFYRRWRPELLLYGLGFLLLVSALSLGKLAAAMVVFVLMCIADAMRRWGEPYRQHGKALLEIRRRAHQQEIAENVAWFMARFHKEAPPPPTPPLESPTPSAEEDAPESPSGPLPDVSPDKLPPPPTGSVTHET